MNDTALISSEVTSFAQQITTTWRKAAAAIIETGAQIVNARKQLSASDFIELKKHLKENEGISEPTISKLQTIACHPVLGKKENAAALPPSYTVLYRLTQADERAVKRALESGNLSPSIQMPDVDKLFFSPIKKNNTENLKNKQSISKVKTVITINAELNVLNKTTQKMLNKVLELVKIQYSVKIEEL